MLKKTCIYSIFLSSGYPNEPAADVALNTVKKWIEDNPDEVSRTNMIHV